MVENFDLFGVPVRERRDMAGRPSHEPTDENRNKIMLLFALGWTKDRVAAALKLSMPTFRKYYFSEIKHADDALLRVKARHIEVLWTQAQAGNVGAIKEFGRYLDRVDLDLLADNVSNRGSHEEAQQRPLGKKDQRIEDAAAVTGKYAPPAGPTRIN
jgi:hypothetical protein